LMKYWDQQGLHRGASVIHGPCRCFLFKLSEIYVVMERGSLWYHRDREKHVWVQTNAWVSYYYDAGVPVIEIEYDSETETILSRREIPGFSTTDDTLLLLNYERKEDEPPFETKQT